MQFISRFKNTQRVVKIKFGSKPDPEAIQRQIKHSPDVPSNYVALALVSNSLTGLTAVNEGIEQCGDEHAELHHMRGALLESLGRFEAAKTAYERAADLDMFDDDALLKAAILAGRLDAEK